MLLRKRKYVYVVRRESGRYMSDKKCEWILDKKEAHAFTTEDAAQLVAKVMSYVLFEDCTVVHVENR